MLQFDPAHRISLSEVKAHPWYNGPVPTLEDIQKEFIQRKVKIEELKTARRLAVEE